MSVACDFFLFVDIIICSQLFEPPVSHSFTMNLIEDDDVIVDLTQDTDDQVVDLTTESDSELEFEFLSDLEYSDTDTEGFFCQTCGETKVESVACPDRHKVCTRCFKTYLKVNNLEVGEKPIKCCLYAWCSKTYEF